MSLKRGFECKACKRSVTMTYQDAPKCCDAYMLGGDPILPVGDITQLRLHSIVLQITPEVDWQIAGEPDIVTELWQLAPGRANGERLGWLGKRATGWEWVMPTGVKIRHGFSPTKELAVQSMLLALQGGLVSKRVIAELA